MSYIITQDAYTTLYNMGAQLRLLASLASQSSANDMHELSVFLEVMASNVNYVLDESDPIVELFPPTDPVERSDKRINPRKRVDGAAA